MNQGHPSSPSINARKVIGILSITVFLVGCDALNNLLGLTPPIITITSPSSNSTVTTKDFVITGTLPKVVGNNADEWLSY